MVVLVMIFTFSMPVFGSSEVQPLELPETVRDETFKVLPPAEEGRIH